MGKIMKEGKQYGVGGTQNADEITYGTGTVADALNGLSAVKIKSVSYTGTTNSGGIITGSLSDFGITDGTQIISAYFARGSYGAVRSCEVFDYGSAGFGFYLQQGTSYSGLSVVASSEVTLTIYYI